MDTNHSRKTVANKIANPAAPMPETCAAAPKPDVSPLKDCTLDAATYEGTLVRVSGKTLVMASYEGVEYPHTVAADAKVSCDGAPCSTKDLKVGSKIRLTTRSDDKKVAVKIESLERQADFIQPA